MSKTLDHFVGGVLITLYLPFKKPLDKQRQKLKQTYLNDPQSITDRQAYYILQEIAWDMYRDGKFAEAEIYADELYRLSQLLKKDWHYGNAIHHYHTIVGLIRLHEGNQVDAKNHLNQAAEVKGSPQLDNLGPIFDLANALLARGEVSAVKKYLAACAKFWKLDDGKLKHWMAAIDCGSSPQMQSLT